MTRSELHTSTYNIAFYLAWSYLVSALVWAELDELVHSLVEDGDALVDCLSESSINNHDNWVQQWQLTACPDLPAIV